MALSRIGDFSLSALMKFVSFSALGGITSYYLMNPRERRLMNSKNLIVATGCDSGLGYSAAIHCHRHLNMAVVACVHDINSKGAKNLKEIFSESNRSYLVELEITEDASVKNLEKFLRDLLGKNKQLGEEKKIIEESKS